MEIYTHRAQETQVLGQKIAARLLTEGRKTQATILALYGELGSGKTTFVRGLGGGLGLPHRLLSPTFIIIREYPLKTPSFRRFYHVDLYRIEAESELTSFGFADIFKDPDNLVVIEWAERMGTLLPKERLDIRFGQVDDTIRKIVVLNNSKFQVKS